ncbi:MAG: sirohydrochlorin cobaltochelatase [Clostridium sp.]
MNLKTVSEIKGTNQNKTGERELLAVSFGTSYKNTRERTIEAIERDMESAMPEYILHRAFTSQIIINRVKQKENLVIDNVRDALKHAVENGVKTLIIQPTHMMKGFEYQDLAEEASEYRALFEYMAVGEPLLTSEEDFETVIRAITEDTKEYDDGETAVCFMGHGTEAEANQVYKKLQSILLQKGFTNYYIGTVEAEPSIEDVLREVKKGSYKKVVLQPLMIVAGDHANNDMAGDEEGSWKREFERAGYEVSCVLKGLGEIELIRHLFVSHVKAAGELFLPETGKE